MLPPISHHHIPPAPQPHCRPSPWLSWRWHALPSKPAVPDPTRSAPHRPTLLGSGSPPHSRPAGFPASLPRLNPSPLPLQPRRASVLTCPRLLLPLLLRVLSLARDGLVRGAPLRVLQAHPRARALLAAMLISVMLAHGCWLRCSSPAHTHPTRGLPRAAAAVCPTRVRHHVLQCASEQAIGLHIPSTCASACILTVWPGLPPVCLLPGR